MRRHAEYDKPSPRGWSATLVLFAALAFASGCERPPSVYHITGPTMGTVFSVKVLPQVPGEDRSEEISRAIQAQLVSIDERMSTYRDDSELSRFNQSTSTEPIPVSGDLYRVFELSHEISKATNGAFDVTVGPLVNAWGFGPGGIVAKPPSAEEMEALHQRVGYEKIELDADHKTLRKRQADVLADLSAIAPGFGADKICDALFEMGYENFMVDVGGEVRATGRNDRGQPWQIGIEKPLSDARVVERIVALDGLSLATSGDYRNYVERDGIRMSHIIDPRTNRPIAHNLASASVIHKECAVADGYATAMMVLGLEEGYETAVREELAVMFIVRNDDGTFADKATPEFDRLMPANGQ